MTQNNRRDRCCRLAVSKYTRLQVGNVRLSSLHSQPPPILPPNDTDKHDRHSTFQDATNKTRILLYSKYKHSTKTLCDIAVWLGRAGSCVANKPPSESYRVTHVLFGHPEAINCRETQNVCVYQTIYGYPCCFVVHSIQIDFVLSVFAGSCRRSFSSIQDCSILGDFRVNFQIIDVVQSDSVSVRYKTILKSVLVH